MPKKIVKKNSKKNNFMQSISDSNLRGTKKRYNMMLKRSRSQTPDPPLKSSLPSPFSSSDSLITMNKKPENNFKIISRFEAEKLDRVQQNKYIADLFDKVKDKISVEKQESYKPISTVKKNYEKIAFLTKTYRSNNKSGGRKMKYRLKTKKNVNKRYKSR
jgi:hypothetical protein|tara:strand:- start:884 stop:1363 length:480 start_codon:yes stop_codon:yes gene_type:complete